MNTSKNSNKASNWFLFLIAVPILILVILAYWSEEDVKSPKPKLEKVLGIHGVTQEVYDPTIHDRLLSGKLITKEKHEQIVREFLGLSPSPKSKPKTKNATIKVKRVWGYHKDKYDV